MAGSVLILTGPPGAGKSTIAKLIAKASPRDAVHLHTDDFYVWIAKGYVEPWKVEARHQNTVVIDAIKQAALAYTNGGYDVIVDGILGPWFLDPFRGSMFDYVVLRPSERETLTRGTTRDHVMKDAAVISQMWKAFADLGALERHAFDSGGQSAAKTAAALMPRIAAGKFRLT